MGLQPEISSTRRRAQAAAFDNIRERYDQAFPHKEGQVAAGEWLIGKLARGARVLDAGCGTGVPTVRQLKEAGLSVTGIDISEGMLTLASQNVRGADLRQLDLTEIRQELGRFDAVVAFFSLLMLSRAELPGALARLRDVLVPGGLLAVSMVEADLDDVPIDFLGVSVRVTGYPRDEFARVVEAAGFEVLEARDLSYAPVSTQVPPEVQLFLYCRKTDSS
jgi:cyclopropane fatty-acyl-phospholipid synthase-like methyltransferase